MNDQQKKLAIIAVLVVVIACVGGFQLMGSKPAPAPQPDLKKEVAKDAPAPEEPTGPKNPTVAAPLPPRDPFQPPYNQIPVTYRSSKPAHTPAPSFGGAPSIPHVSPLPPFGSGPVNPAVGPMVTTPAPKPPEEPPFPYHAVGEIGGDRPAALFEDGAGNQRMVPVGASIDAYSTVIGLRPDSVLVEYRGRKLRLSIGGTPVGK